MELVSYNSLIVRVRTPDGTLFATISENKEGEPFMVQFNIGKAGASVGAWSQALAATISMGLQAGIPIHKFIEELSGISSDRTARSLGSSCRSGPEGVYMALLRYTKQRFNELQEQLGVDNNFDDDDDETDDESGRASVSNRARVRGN